MQTFRALAKNIEGTRIAVTFCSVSTCLPMARPHPVICAGNDPPLTLHIDDTASPLRKTSDTIAESSGSGATRTLTYATETGGTLSIELTDDQQELHIRLSPSFHPERCTAATGDSSRWLVLPGNYSGDAWAAAMALSLTKDIRVLVLTKDNPNSSFKTIADQFHEFCEDTCVSARVSTAGGLPARQVVAHAAVSAAKAALPSDAAVCGWTYATSSVLLEAAIREGSLDGVLSTLRKSFTPSKEVMIFEAEVVKKLRSALDLIASTDNCLLVNMRVGNKDNHPQNDMSPLIFAQISKIAEEGNFTIVRVGGYQDNKSTPGALWMKDLTSPVIEFFTPGKRVRRCLIAWFWQEVAKLKNVRGIVGGCSGSLDIAALMGVRTLSWAVADPSDHEYVRLALYFPIMSIVPRESAKVTPRIRKKKDHYPGTLDQAGLALWLAGYHILPSTALTSTSSRFLRQAPSYDDLDPETMKRLYMAKLEGLPLH